MANETDERSEEAQACYITIHKVQKSAKLMNNAKLLCAILYDCNLETAATLPEPCQLGSLPLVKLVNYSIKYCLRPLFCFRFEASWFYG